MRYPNRLYAVEGGDLHYILSEPPPISGGGLSEYDRFCIEKDREEAEYTAMMEEALSKYRKGPPPRPEAV